MALKQRHRQNMRNLLLISVFAIFISCSTESTPVYNLNTNTTPAEAGSVTPASSQADEGKKLQITAGANEHWVFSGWQGDHTGTSNPASILMDRDKTVTAMFQKRDYPLTVTIEGEGTVTEEVIQAKTTDYPHGTTVRLTAQPEDGWLFTGWQGDMESEENPIKVTIEEEKIITANFERIEYSLNLLIEGKGEVQETIIKSKTVDYPHGSVLELEAVPESGSVFTGWQEDIKGIENPIELEMLGEYTIKALFEEVADVEVEGNGSVLIELYNDGNPKLQENYSSTGRLFKLAPFPAPKYKFSHWEGDYEGNEESIIVEAVDGLINIRAVFLTEQSEWVLQFHENDIDYNSGTGHRETEIWLEDVNFANSSYGWAVGGGASTGSRSLILKTTDGGQNWKEWDKAVGEEEKLYSVHSRQAGFGNYFTWVGGWSGSMVRITGGITDNFHGYTTQEYYGQSNVTGIHFFRGTDPTRIFSEGIITRYGGGRIGMLKKVCCIDWSPYNQHGSIWNEVNFPYTLEDIHFAVPSQNAEENGWVVGFTRDRRSASDWDYIGIVGRTTDRGSTWELIKSNINARLLAVHSLSEYTAWVAGRSGGFSSRGGVIYRTTDGGKNWELQLSVGSPIRDIHFTDRFNGWAIRYNGTIYRTRDGGENWHIEASSLGLLNAIYFSDRNHGWVVGSHGRIYRYYPVD